MSQCPICLEDVSVLVRDHDHRTGFIRGKICNPCNGKLGLLERHPESYYLRKKPGGRLWRRWVTENAERIYAHLQKNTWVHMGRMRSLGLGLILGLPLALALPKFARTTDPRWARRRDDELAPESR